MSTGYKIKEVAERSGFSAATLRYYEEIGLLPPAERTPGGYRVYHERTMERLAFIARAKQLGCSLDEISDLTTAWDGGRCGPLQDRLRAVVAEKLASARQQVLGLATLTTELRQAAVALERHRPEGACDERCGCVVETPASPGPVTRAATVTAGREPVATEVPVACALGAGAMRHRLAEWQTVLSFVSRREEMAGGVRLVLDRAVPLDELTKLVAAEHHCCQFFAFAITIDRRGIALEVTAPADAQSIVQSMFGADITFGELGPLA